MQFYQRFWHLLTNAPSALETPDRSNHVVYAPAMSHIRANVRIMILYAV